MDFSTRRSGTCRKMEKFVKKGVFFRPLSSLFTKKHSLFHEKWHFWKASPSLHPLDLYHRNTAQDFPHLSLCLVFVNSGLFAGKKSFSRGTLQIPCVWGVEKKCFLFLQCFHFLLCVDSFGFPDICNGRPTSSEFR